jgi:hypothetical protein
MFIIERNFEKNYYYENKRGFLMQITGERALVNIENETFYTKRIDVADDETIPLDALFSEIDSHIENENFIHIELQINGGVESTGTTLSVETNVINLPLRYQNQLRKLVWQEKDALDVNLYMIAENEFESQSHLRISLASSVATYVDDSESVKAKISTWFNEQLEHIVNEQKQAEKEDVGVEE